MMNKIYIAVIVLITFFTGCKKGQYTDVIANESLDVTRALVKSGKININSKMGDNNIPLLELAIIHQRKDLVKYLLSEGVNLNATNNQGFTPLQALESTLKSSGPNRQKSISNWMQLGLSKEEAEKRNPEVDSEGRKWDQVSYENLLHIKDLILKSGSDSQESRDR